MHAGIHTRKSCELMEQSEKNYGKNLLRLSLKSKAKKIPKMLIVSIISWLVDCNVRETLEFCKDFCISFSYPFESVILRQEHYCRIIC